jgi:hypothetical protein
MSNSGLAATCLFKRKMAAGLNVRRINYFLLRRLGYAVNYLPV